MFGRGLLLFIIYILIGVCQIMAFLEGMQLYFALGGILSFIVFLVTYNIPLVGTAFVAVMTYYGARWGWRWEPRQAILLAAPGLVFMGFLMATTGLTALFSRRAS